MENEIQAHEEAPEEAAEAIEVDAGEHEVSQSETAKEWSDEVEQEARDFGWKSPDEWKGTIPPGYIDNPEDFVARQDRNPAVRKLRRDLEQSQRKVSQELGKITAALEAGHKRELERQQAEYKRQIGMISAGQRRAVEEADTERFDALEQQRQRVAPPDLEPTPEQPQADPIAEYVDSHPWLNDAMMRNAGAVAIDQAMQSGAIPPNATVAQQVEYAEQRVKDYFPHMFKQPEPTPKPRAKVDGGGLGAKARAGFDSLPKDARDAFGKFVGQGVFEDTKEDREFYFNEYQNG